MLVRWSMHNRWRHIERLVIFAPVSSQITSVASLPHVARVPAMHPLHPAIMLTQHHLADRAQGLIAPLPACQRSHPASDVSSLLSQPELGYSLLWRIKIWIARLRPIVAVWAAQTGRPVCTRIITACPLRCRHAQDRCRRQYRRSAWAEYLFILAVLVWPQGWMVSASARSDGRAAGRLILEANHGFVYAGGVLPTFTFGAQLAG